ncbi:hypothetical protein ANCCAN_00409 [Ancylostoma caninum]|uniref:Uncharacterized protein n=1 Tax=Ancylostoma caninum TaxID=29170 RepID=A0A368H9X3_ANCCA|nr:hypothetical protein ANCCAN_00409 [Ancylostoma caninum]
MLTGKGSLVEENFSTVEYSKEFGVTRVSSIGEEPSCWDVLKLPEVGVLNASVLVVEVWSHQLEVQHYVQALI